jgi:hypothetical protein
VLKRTLLCTLVAACAIVGEEPNASQAHQPLTFAGVQPQLTKAGDRVFLVSGRDNVISVRSSGDGGQTFGAPTNLTVPGRMMLGMHRGPRIAVAAGVVLVSVIAGPKGGDGDLLLYRSIDGGATFAAPVVINDVPGSAREGLHALGANDQSFAMLAWLDLRSPGTKIYSAVSRTSGANWSADTLVFASSSGSVCECCHPSIAPGNGAAGRGRAVMFRNNLNGYRDMYVVRSPDGETYGVHEKSGRGSWKLDACPMDGGAVVLSGTQVFSVWRRENEVYLAVLGRAEIRIGTGRDPVIDVSGRHLDVAWSSPQGTMLMRDNGPHTTLGEGRFPAIVSLAERTVVAWEHQGSVKVLSIPR